MEAKRQTTWCSCSRDEFLKHSLHLLVLLFLFWAYLCHTVHFSSSHQSEPIIKRCRWEFFGKQNETNEMIKGTTEKSPQRSVCFSGASRQRRAIVKHSYQQQCQQHFGIIYQNEMSKEKSVNFPLRGRWIHRMKFILSTSKVLARWGKDWALHASTDDL